MFIGSAVDVLSGLGMTAWDIVRESRITNR